MIALVTGGAASGKSAYAERLAKALPGPHAYVATMRHGDAETEARIERHRRMREGKGFVTVELADATDLSALGGGMGVMLKQSCFGEMSTSRSRGLPDRCFVNNSQDCSPCGTARDTHTPAENCVNLGSADTNGGACASHSLRNRAAAPQLEPHPQLDGVVLECRTALLEDLGNLVANGLQEKIEDVLAFENVVVVANEVGCDGVRYDPFTMGYIEELGALACQLGARADVVVEVVAGIPNVVKGTVPSGC